MIKLLATLLLIHASLARASFDASSKGTTSADFLELGVGARAASMGEAYTAATGGAEALYWNPAALSRVKGRTVTFMHAAYIASTYYDYGAYAQRAGEGTFAIGLKYFSAGEMTETDALGAEVGRFSPKDSEVSFGYARPVRDFSLGFALKSIRSSVLDAAYTVAADIGVLSPAVYKDRLRIGAALFNVGGRLRYEDKREKLPAGLRLGAAYEIKDIWNLNFDFGFPENSAPYLAIGTEYIVLLPGSWKAAGRCGFNSRTVGDIKGFTGISFGVGASHAKYDFDYGFSPMGEIGSAHRISISTRF